MIANVDWSAKEPAPDEEDCGHNGKLIGTVGHGVIVLPYDFDQSGLVSAAYATPMSDLRYVRERRCRGYCVAEAPAGETSGAEALVTAIIGRGRSFCGASVQDRLARPGPIELPQM
jgi:hypothetical protein